MKNNYVYLHGRLAADPETRTIDSGLSITNITVVTSDPYKNKNGEKIDEPCYHKVVYMGNIAEMVAKYFKKGDGIISTGSLRYRTVGEGDNRKYYTDISGQGFQFPLGRKTDNQSQEAVKNQSKEESTGEDDDLPF